MDLLSKDKITEFQNIIWNYYKENPRVFPWRETTDPYEILVSEIMLQQTQTERVVPKYEEWLHFFPTMEALYKASLSDVLTHWNGLGYNRRGRFLQQACSQIISDFQGVFPTDPDILDSLPGIGPYTARAVTTFSFNKKEVFIETNIRSVYIFFFYMNGGSISPENLPLITDKELLNLIEQTLPEENFRYWYYALMDYGATLKKIVKNPNRKSAHYTKQSKFEGSLRQARGAIIRQLTGTDIKKSLLDIALIEEIEYQRIEKAAESLIAEGLIKKQNNLYVIND